MSASAFVGYILAAALVRWGLQYLTPRADLLIGVGSDARSNWVRLAPALSCVRGSRPGLRGSQEERERLRPALWQALGLKPALSMALGDETGYTFDYPPASRGLASILFWISVIFAAGPLVALIRSPTEPGDGWGLFGLGALFAWAAANWGAQLRSAGVKLRVTDDRLEEVLGAKVRQIHWGDLRSVHRSRLHRLTFRGHDGTEINVFPHLRGSVQFEDLLGRRLKHGSGVNSPGHG